MGYVSPIPLHDGGGINDSPTPDPRAYPVLAASTNSGNIYFSRMRTYLPEGAPYAPVSTEEQTAEQADTSQIAANLGQHNEQLASDFGEPEITDFNIYVVPVPFLKTNNGGVPDLGAPAAWHPAYPGDSFDDIAVVETDDPTPSTDAEVVESYEVHTNNWSPFLTNGESLSRVLSNQFRANDGGDFANIEFWWDDGHKDYVNGNPDYNSKDPLTNGFELDSNGGYQTETQASDRNMDGNGCGVLFLYYLHDDLGYNWTDIIHAQGTTLGEKYQSLTGKDGKQGFQDFLNALPTTTDDAGNTSLALTPGGDPLKVNNPNYVESVDGLKLRPVARLSDANCGVACILAHEMLENQERHQEQAGIGLNPQARSRFILRAE